MSDWAVGDLAVCVADKPCGHCGADPDVKLGSVYLVVAVRPGLTQTALSLEGVSDAPGHYPGLPVCRFRKAVTDKREACEPEFVTLLKRSKQPAVIEQAQNVLAMSRLWDEAADAAMRRDDEGFRKAMDQFHQRRARHGNVSGVE